MGIFDNLKNKAAELADQHDDKVDQAIGKVGDVVDERTGGKHSANIDKAVDFAQEKTGDGDTAA